MLQTYVQKWESNTMAKTAKESIKRKSKILPVPEEEHSFLTGEWIEKDYLSPEKNQQGRDKRADLEERFRLWQKEGAELTATWGETLRSLPRNLLEDERDRRLAIAKKLTKVPDQLLSFELERREAEQSNEPIVFLDL